MSARFFVVYDAQDDGTFSTALSASVVRATWRLGMARAYDGLAQVGEALLTVRAPEGLDALFPQGVPFGLRMQIRSEADGVSRVQFTGTLVQLTPSTGDWGAHTAELRLVCPLAGVYAQQVSAALLENARVAGGVHALLDAAALPLRWRAGAWQLGNPATSTLDTSTRLPVSDAFTPRDFQDGVSVFEWLGDTWDDVPLARALRELIDAERGRFYVNREGAFVLLERHELLRRRTPSATLNATMRGLTMRYGGEVVNTVQVRMSPRQAAQDAVLWTLASPQRIPQAGAVTFNAALRGTQGEQVSALRMHTPRPYADYIANSQPDGSGQDLTPHVELRVLGLQPASARVQLLNNAPQNAYLVMGQLRGRARLTAPPLTVATRDGFSQALYGTQRLSLDLPALTRVEDAHNLAQYELQRRRQPTLSAHTLTLGSSAHSTLQRELTLYERVHIQEPFSAHSGDYFIVAEAHTVTHGGAAHSTEWQLEPTDAAGFWVLDSGTLNTSTRLTY